MITLPAPPDVFSPSLPSNYIPVMSGKSMRAAKKAWLLEDCFCGGGVLGRMNVMQGVSNYASDQWGMEVGFSGACHTAALGLLATLQL